MAVRSRIALRILQVAGVLVMLAFGLGTLLLVDGGGRAFGAWWTLFGLTVAVALAVDWRSRPLFPELTTFEGRPALVVYRRLAPFVVGLVLVAEMALGFAILAGALAVSGQVAGAVLAGALAVVLAWPLGYAATGRYVAGAVWLSPDGLVSRLHGVELRVAWTDLELAVGDGAREHVALRPRSGVRLGHVGRAGRWRGVRTIDAPDLVVMPAAELGVDAVSLGLLIQLAIVDERTRAELGTHASLQTLAAIVLAPR